MNLWYFKLAKALAANHQMSSTDTGAENQRLGRARVLCKKGWQRVSRTIGLTAGQAEKKSTNSNPLQMTSNH